jgi:hypothetical protein
MVLLEKNLGITLTESLVFEHPTIEDLVRYFLSVLFPGNGSASPPANASVPLSPARPAAATAEPASESDWVEHVQEVTALSTDELLRELRGGA